MTLEYIVFMIHKGGKYPAAKLFLELILGSVQYLNGCCLNNLPRAAVLDAAESGCAIGNDGFRGGVVLLTHCEISS